MIRSKTLRFAVLLAVLGVLEVNGSLLRGFLNPVLGETWAGMVLLLVSVVVAVLRIVTTKPLADK